jgi:hypothetical protein
MATGRHKASPIQGGMTMRLRAASQIISAGRGEMDTFPSPALAHTYLTRAALD